MKDEVKMLQKFHETQIVIAAFFAFASMICYMIGPADRISLAHDVCFVSCAFLFGKFTNGFRKKELKTREGDATGGEGPPVQLTGTGPERLRDYHNPRTAIE